MATGQKKNFNSWGIAEDHGDVWITGMSGSDYRDGQLALWGVVAPSHVTFTPEPNERINFSKDRYHVFVTFADAAKWCFDHYGIIGFKRDKFGGYHPSTTDHDVACGRHIHRTEGRSFSVWPCDRLSVDGGECKLHRSLTERQETKRAAEAEAERVRKERSTSGQRIAKDAIDALAEEEITATPDWNRGGYNGRVSVHAEDVLTMVRELRRLREILGR